jgi:5,6-dimethylbenzimidazole synthase
MSGNPLPGDFSSAQIDAIYSVIARRRDVRAFRPDPVPDDVLARILGAAHHAGSVGFMQPWNFVIVRSRETRQAIWAHVDAERRRAADDFSGQRREQYLSFKLEGILDSPLNICVTCDPSRNGPAVLGRHTIRETDVYSACCAVQNLWLAARAEGVGVGWVSILSLDFLRETLRLPAQVIPVAYLCAGYPIQFDSQPLLERAGWLPRASLRETVFDEQWGQAVNPELGGRLDQIQM